ncbi:zinc-binding alcohol dehydrogenase family protein [Herbidospora cretacea]|uniref:zinc-binding alcohol dehydrogenase family protein n=1 Tax=Herbidospora cretacea TaxID=28444 RepID=UPI0007746E15|nr:zinc-binding alcohol dehydrogenase family protein [Herbidospora cretacea]
MRAISTSGSGLVDVDVPEPQLRPHDLLVQVEAVSVNPVDVKIAASAGDERRILGFDAAGTVVRAGPEVTGFTVGDEVYYSGDVTRQGADAELHAVDARIAGHKPGNLSMAEAAAVPLTTITAWESLFTHFGADAGTTGTLLVVGAPGGVGSMLVQLAKQLTSLRVIGTASRPETRERVLALGGDATVDHRSLAASVKDVAPDGVDFLFSPFSEGNIETYAEIVKPFGHVVAIDDHHVDVFPLKSKSIAWHWELMFTHAIYQTPDMASQGRLLDETARLLDEGRLRTTLGTEIADFSAAGLRRAHELVADGKAVGKVVVTR